MYHTFKDIKFQNPVKGQEMFLKSFFPHNKYWMFPSWLFIVMMSPFLSDNHPMKDISLKEWDNGATEMARMYNCVMCFLLAGIIAMTLRLIVF